jgi:hypothetical protein
MRQAQRPPVETRDNRVVHCSGLTDGPAGHRCRSRRRRIDPLRGVVTGLPPSARLHSPADTEAGGPSAATRLCAAGPLVDDVSGTRETRRPPVDPHGHRGSTHARSYPATPASLGTARAGYKARHRHGAIEHSSRHGSDSSNAGCPDHALRSWGSHTPGRLTFSLGATRPQPDARRRGPPWRFRLASVRV